MFDSIFDSNKNNSEELEIEFLLCDLMPVIIITDVDDFIWLKAMELQCYFLNVWSSIRSLVAELWHAIPLIWK